MALSQIQQFNEIVSRSQNVLVCFGKHYTADEVASALAIGAWLKKLKKRFSLVADDFHPGPELKFLSGLAEIESKLTNLRQFVISLDLADKQVSEFSYDVKEELVNGVPQRKLEVYVLPDGGSFNQDNVALNTTAYRFDLIICLGVPDLESLGKIYTNQTDFFFKTPVIDIDHQPANENYGQLNLVDLTAVAVAEVIYNLISQIDANLIDEEMATALFAGVLAKSAGFKAGQITPQSLQLAAKLMQLGADREKIVTNFYRTKTLPMLKLWGRVLARLQFDRELKLVWSALPASDFIKAGSDESGLRGVMDELVLNSPQAELALLLWEKTTGNIGGRLFVKNNHDAKHLLNNLTVTGNRQMVEFEIAEKSLGEVEAEVVGEIRKKLEIRN